MQHRQLEAFISTMQTGSTTAAAQALFISQPSVSRLISDLEVSVGFALFIRGKGSLKPTPEAFAFYEEAVQSFRGLEKLKQFAISIGANTSGHLRVACVHALSLGLLPRVCSAFNSKYPDSTLSVRADGTISRILTDLKDGSVDIALLPRQPDLPTVAQNHLVDVEFVCAVPPDDTLAKLDLIEPPDLIDRNVIMLDPIGDFVWRQHSKTLEEIGSPASGRISTTTSPLAYGLVAEGLGVAVVDGISAGHWRHLGVQVRRFRPLIQYEFVAAFPIGKARSKLTQEFYQISREVAGRIIRKELPD